MEEDRLTRRNVMREIEDLLDEADIATVEAIRDFIKDIV